MFQYAVGRAIAEMNDTNYKVDLSFYNRSSGRYRINRSTSDTIYYQLDNFSLSAEEATVDDINDVLRLGTIGKRVGDIFTDSRPAQIINQKYLLSYATSKLFNYYKEPDVTGGVYNNWLEEAGPDCYLNGYWESPKYFERIRNIIESEFSPSEDISNESKLVSQRIKNTNSVGLHVRRGDVVEFDNALPVSYFEEAIDSLGKEDVTYFVFSVDPNWVKKNIDIDGPVEYVDHHHPDGQTRTPLAWEYLLLMSQCDDKIISNSTFSWWAAWLGQSTETKVMCPAIWKLNYDGVGAMYVDDLDLIPTSWEVIHWD